MTGLPVAWQAETARRVEVTVASDLVDRLADRGIAVEVAVRDRGYDTTNVDAECEVPWRPARGEPERLTEVT